MNAENQKYIFQYKFYDQQWSRWGDFIDVSECSVEDIDTFIDRWKDEASSYLDIGAKYEYRIIKRTDEIIWSEIYSDNKNG